MELIDIVNAITKKRGWDDVTDLEKEKNFFIINRYMSKMYPIQAQLLNLKTIDKVSGLNLWYHFMLNQPYPKWFWSKGEKSEKIIPEKDYNLLLIKLRIKKEDLDYLISSHFEFVQEELKYFKALEKLQ